MNIHIDMQGALCHNGADILLEKDCIMKQRIVSLAALLCLVLCLTACGQGSTGSTDSQSEAATPMTEEEALVQTDLIGHDFYVFTNATTGLVNVIYHRKNGGYGIIKPKIEEENEQ